MENQCGTEERVEKKLFKRTATINGAQSKVLIKTSKIDTKCAQSHTSTCNDSVLSSFEM